MGQRYHLRLIDVKIVTFHDAPVHRFSGSRWSILVQCRRSESQSKCADSEALCYEQRRAPGQ